MRILLDENVPVGFAAQIKGHEVFTVSGLGWSGILNGELLRRAQEKCDVFITLDQNLQYQQSIKSLPFAVIVIRCVSNRLARLVPLAPAVLAAIAAGKPGDLQIVGA